MPTGTIELEKLTQWLRDPAILTWSVDTRGLPIDQRYWTTITGQSAETMRDGGWLDAVHRDDRDRVVAAWSTAIAHGQSYNIDHRIRCADGIYRWFNVRATPIRSTEGDIERWAGVCMQISGQWRFQADAGAEAMTVSEPLGASIIRAARAMLNWSAADLCERSGVSVSTIRRLENQDSEVRSRRTSTDRLRHTFQAAGLALVDGDGAVSGVRWASRPRHDRSSPVIKA